MGKEDVFASLDLDSDFSARGPISGFDRFDDPRDAGKRRLENAAIITLDRIIAKDQVREEFDQEEHEKLVASLQLHGQQQAIRVRWSQEDQRYVIIQGERRFRAAHDAGLTELECLIEKGDLTEGQIIERQLVENTHRKQLNVIEEGRAYQKLMDLRACTAKDLAADIGVSPNTVQRAVRLLSLPEDIVREVERGELPKSLMRSIQAVKAATPEATEAEQRRLIEQYKAGASFVAVAAKAGVKSAASTAQVARGIKKAHTVGKIKLQATSRNKVTNIEIAEALREWADELDAKSRSRAA